MGIYDLTGSTVTFMFSNHPPISGVVQSAPTATGDAWEVVCEEQVYLIQQYDYLLVRARPGEND